MSREKQHGLVDDSEDSGKNEERIRALEAEVARLSSTIERVVVGHKELERRLAGNESP